MDRIPPDALPFRIHCRGVRNGRRCSHPIASYERGIYWVRDNGREHDVNSTTCPKCKTLRQFAGPVPAELGGVPEEIGGSSGVLRAGHAA